MHIRNDSDLRIAIAQSLENLNRAGLRWVERGQSNSITQWMMDYGASITANAIAVETEVSASESTTARPLVLEQEERPALSFSTTLPPIVKPETNKLGTWNSTLLPVSNRQAVLDAEAQLVSACNKCSQLVCSRSRTVYGVGNSGTEIVFIGEGPGAEEDRQGIPFVGPAGQLLDKIITAMNLQRSNVYIMNAVKCRPQNNRTPSDEEIENCQPFFVKQLETIQPKFIVCLGAVAARALLKTSLGIGKLRGKFYSYCGAQVAVTYHPAYLLRNPDAKKLTWDDMKKVMAAM